MNISAGPIRRPVLTLMIYLIVITLGVVSLSRLAIDLMPDVTFPTLSVSASYGNVGPEEMEDLVTRPLEEALAAIQGVEEITSTSSEGASRVRVAFTWGTDLEGAANDIRDRIDRILGRLPEDMERPTIRKFDLSAIPVIILGVASDLNLLQLNELIEDKVKYRLERVPGVASVDLWGGLNREIHINLNADKLRALQLAPEAVLNALQAENRNIPAGTYESGNLELLVRTEGEYQSLDEIRLTPVAVRSGTVVRVGDVASVEDSWEEVTRIVRLNGKPGLRIAVNKQSGYNTVRVADAVKKELVRINADFPQMELLPVIDSSKYIRNAINNMGRAAIFGGILAMLILLLFLRRVRSALVVATAVPISVIATFAVMYFGGFTLNLMTFGGLALGIGMLLDSSIVVLESIHKHHEMGKSVAESALVGANEVRSAIIASTLTTLVVFAPVIFIRGISGVMFQQLAFVITFALLCSLMVSLTLVPLLATRTMNTGTVAPNKDGWLRRLFNRSAAAQVRLETFYAGLLNWALHHRRTVVITAACLFAMSLLLIPIIGVELMPATDEGEVRIDLEMAVGTRLELVDNASKKVEEIVRQSVPELVYLQSSAGGGGGGHGVSGGHTASLRATLVPIGERSRSSDEIARDLAKQLNSLPGVSVRCRPGHGLFILRTVSSGSDDRLSVEIRGHDLKTGELLAQQLDAIMRNVRGVTDTRVSREEGRPEQIIRINRFKAADLGLSVARIGDILKTALGGTYSSNYREGGKEYRILTRLREADRHNLDNLLDLTVVNNRGAPVQLRNVVDVLPATGPVSIERKDQERIITITGDYSGRDLGSIVGDLRRELQRIPIPRDFSIIFGGDWEEQKEATRELLLGVILAIILTYMVMAGQFESLRYPLVVMFSVPMAFIGVMLIMLLTGTTFSINALIGCIMLAGIVVNNAILLVDYTNLVRRRDGLELFDAVRAAGARRLRPILMTSFTTILALVPLSLGLGEGGETQAPLARVVIGGLASSTLVTLILIPVIYTLFEEKLKRRIKNVDSPATTQENREPAL